MRPSPQQAVDAHAHAEAVLEGLDVDVRGAQRNGVAEHLVDEADDRRVLGRFVEIAEADIRSNAMLPMGSFAHNVSFSAVDLRHIAQADLDLTERLLKGTIELLAEGKIKHPGPLHRYPVSKIEQAFRHLQGGKNIGRIMITLDRTDVVPVSGIPDFVTSEPVSVTASVN